MTDRILVENALFISATDDNGSGGGDDEKSMKPTIARDTSPQRVDATGEILSATKKISSLTQNERAVSRCRSGRNTTTTATPGSVSTDAEEFEMRFEIKYEDHKNRISIHREQKQEQQITHNGAKNQLQDQPAVQNATNVTQKTYCLPQDQETLDDRMEEKCKNTDERSEDHRNRNINLCLSDTEPSTKSKVEETSIETISKPDVAESDIFTADFFRRKIEALNDIADLFSPEKCKDGGTPNFPDNLLDKDIRKASSSHLVDQPASHIVKQITNKSPLKNESSSVSLQESMSTIKKESMNTEVRSSMVNFAGEVTTSVRTGNRVNSDANIVHRSQEISGNSSTNFESSSKTIRKEMNETSDPVEGLLGSSLMCCESFMSFDADEEGKGPIVGTESSDDDCVGLSPGSQLPYQLLMNIQSIIETEKDATKPTKLSGGSDYPGLQFYPAKKCSTEAYSFNPEKQFRAVECTQRISSGLNETMSTCSSSRDLPMGEASFAETETNTKSASSNRNSSLAMVTTTTMPLSDPYAFALLG
eukprot:CAMPEP_0197199384 /NCGR_PEP_ID=MMETSP1423-20130617/33857_1 /TAXON_ID=476441 /ORGANISM="Pseudo-nitzschia heimii, Strain UNC1101" /LENGTH=533 /DNA_ID=CAMNT_0042653239 /DNA_START=290 /DNA_END=1892 /DNA_ORIENTATION=-